MVIARLNVRAQPLDRGEAFEDPLDEILQAGGKRCQERGTFSPGVLDVHAGEARSRRGRQPLDLDPLGVSHRLGKS